MNDYFGPWVRMQQQLISQHKNNVEAVFKQMNDTGFGDAAKAAKQLADQQTEAWEKWLALWGPKQP
jgi:hypothetical protein